MSEDAAADVAAEPDPADEAAGEAATGAPADDAPATGDPLSVEGLLDDLERVSAERDAYLDDSRRLAADFANFRRQTEKRNQELVEQANARLLENLLPTLDACEAAVRHGAKDVEPVLASLLAVLEREGLARLRPEGEPFDPAAHEAVMHEAADEPVETPSVVEVLRTGYALHGRVVRAALVKVRG